MNEQVRVYLNKINALTRKNIVLETNQKILNSLKLNENLLADEYEFILPFLHDHINQSNGHHLHKLHNDYLEKEVQDNPQRVKINNRIIQRNQS